MNKNGQIFSLDFIISVILADLAIGLILNFSELTVQNMKENEIFEELQIVGETASDLLVSNPDIVCKLVENDNGTPDDPDDDVSILFMQNCVTAVSRNDVPPGQWRSPYGYYEGGWWTAPGQADRFAKVIRKEDLGIPADYDCELTISGGALNPSSLVVPVIGCNSFSSGTEDIYSIERKLVYYNTEGNGKNLKRADFENCIS